MMKKSLLIVMMLLLTIFSLVGCTNEGNEQKTYYHVYSNKIESLEYVAMLTGVNAYENTQEKWDIGGTDLGFPYYDSTRGQMYFLFGDTFHGINTGDGNWRSQVIGISTDLDASDGIEFDSFISNDKKGWATQIIPALHDPNDAEGERTTIPTGGIAINGVHYVFYMSVREWFEIGWAVNFCGLAKSTDGKNFTVSKDIFWAEDDTIGQINAASILNVNSDNIGGHVSQNFLQVFPYQVGEYVYLFGITNGRSGGCKLARVLTTDIEDFSKYEYYTGKDFDSNPIWVKGTEGLKKIKNNDDSYILEPQVGELSVSYNKYLGKYVMSFYSLDRIVMSFSDDLINWSNVEVLISSNDLIIPYGGFSHEYYMEQDGKVMYFFISQYYEQSLGDNGYNVKIVKCTFK